MTQDHPITPPPELMQQWATQSPIQANDENWYYEYHIATQAARWGADQELEACCKWIPAATPWDADQLRAARRPKPLSLKQMCLMHLSVIERDGHYIPEILGDLRRALEALPDD